MLLGFRPFKVGDYITALREISVVQQSFDSEYAPVYTKYLHEVAESVVEEHQKMRACYLEDSQQKIENHDFEEGFLLF